MQSIEMQGHTPEYKFFPLAPQEFRLLIVEPAADHNDLLRCRVETSSHFSGSYNAVSWSWGSPVRARSLLVDGSLLNIPVGLYAALVALRSPTEERVYWADAACIDMQNDEEHGQQVLLIESIYKEAACVYVWLGDEDKTSGEAMTFIRRVCKARDLDDVIRGDRYRQPWASVVTLMLRPWFSRSWIFQEIAVARKATVVCGRDSVDWAEFEACASLLEKRALIYPDTLQVGALPPIQLLRTVRDSFDRRGGGDILAPRLTLQELVTRLSFLQASDFHDQIYSVLGVAKDAKDYPVPDYSLSVSETYNQFVQHCIKTNGSLDIIFRPWAPERLREFLPAWVYTTDSSVYGVYNESTGLSVVRLAGDLFVGDPDKPSGYRASGEHKPNDNVAIVRDAENGLVLSCDGFVVDVICEATSPAHSGTIPPEWFELGMGTSATMPEEFWKTLIADRDHNGQRPAPYIQIYLEQGLLPSGHGTLDLDRIIKERQSSVLSPILSRVRDVVFGRSLVKTLKHRFLGLVPATAMKGDLICVLHGCSVPVVLRTCGDGQQLIGECYIHGIMDGEAVDMSTGNLSSGKSGIGASIESFKILASRVEEKGAPGQQSKSPMILTSALPDLAVLSEAPILADPVSAVRLTPLPGVPQFFWRRHRIHWTCTCGHIGHDTIAEFDPGVIDEMVEVFRGNGVAINLEKVDMSDPFVSIWREVWLFVYEFTLNLLNDWRHMTGASTAATSIRSDSIDETHSLVEVDRVTSSPPPQAAETAPQAKQIVSEIPTTGGKDPAGSKGISSVPPFQSRPAGTPPTTSTSASGYIGTSSNTAAQSQGAAGTQALPPAIPRRSHTAGTRVARGTTQETLSQTVHTYYLALFVDHSRYFRKMLEANITSSKKERELFKTIRTAYHAEKGFSRLWSWLSVRRVIALNFVKFTHVPRLPPTYEVDNLRDPDVPPPTEQRYEMKPNPPLSVPPHDPRRFMMHRFSSPFNCELNSEETWKHMPKRKDGKPSDDDGSVWGIYMLEGFDERLVAAWVGLLCVFTVVFSALWAVFHSVADAFAMGAWIFGMGAVLLATLQIAMALLEK